MHLGKKHAQALTIGTAAVALMSSTFSLRAATIYTVEIATISYVNIPNYGAPATSSVLGTITTNGASNVNPFTDIISYNLVFTWAVPNVGYTHVSTFNSTNSAIASTNDPSGFSTTTSLAPCQFGLCVHPGILSIVRNDGWYLIFGISSVSAAIDIIQPSVGAERTFTQLPYDPSVNGAGLTNTPLPAALPLFASGAALVGLMVRRRKRPSVTA